MDKSKLDKKIGIKDQEFQAIVVDNKDPEKAGRVKIRVPGIHPTDLSEDELPWVLIQPVLGANMGQGIKNIVQPGQFCTVKSLNSSGSDWIVSGGSSIIREELNQAIQNIDVDGAIYSNVVNDVLEKEIIPKIASTNIGKLMSTTFGLMLLNQIDFKISERESIIPSSCPGGSDPSVPALPYGCKLEPLFEQYDIWKIKCNEIDFRKRKPIRTSLGPVPTNCGSCAGNFNFDCINSGSTAPCTPDRVDCDLLPSASGLEEYNKKRNLVGINEVQVYSDDLYGWDLDGNKVYPYFDNWQLIIPPNVDYGDDPKGYKDYTLKYRVIDKLSENEINSDINDIHIRVYGPEFDESSLITTVVLDLKALKEPSTDELDIVEGILPIDIPDDIEDIEEILLKPITMCKPKKTSKYVKLPCVPAYDFLEFEPESHKGQPENKHVEQLPNGMTVELDGSQDNAYYAIKHPKGSRFELFDDGRGILKTTKSLQIQSMNNLMVMVQNFIEVAALKRINLKTEQLFIDAINGNIICNELKIMGNLHIKGTVRIDGKLFVNGKEIKGK